VAQTRPRASWHDFQERIARRGCGGRKRIAGARGGQFLNKTRTRAREKRKSRNNSREEFSRELLASRPRINRELREDQLRKMVDRARGTIAGPTGLIGRESGADLQLRAGKLNSAFCPHHLIALRSCGGATLPRLVVFFRMQLCGRNKGNGALGGVNARRLDKARNTYCCGDQRRFEALKAVWLDENIKGQHTRPKPTHKGQVDCDVNRDAALALRARITSFLLVPPRRRRS